MSSARLRATFLALALCAATFATSSWSETLRDPTEPPLRASGAGSELDLELPEPRVSSILISTGRRQAVIDGERVEVGDLLAGGEVVAIEATEVRLIGPEGPVSLPLYRVPVQKRTPIED